MENHDDVLKSKKLLQYINEFWICFNKEDNKEDKDEMLEVLMRALDRADKKVEECIKKYE